MECSYRECCYMECTRSTFDMSGAFAVHQIGSFRLMKRICAREEKGIERAWRVCVGGTR